MKSPIFDSQQCNIPQKKPHENRHSDLKWNYRILEWKSWKKKINFQPQKMIIFYRSRTNFWKTCQDRKRITLSSPTWDVYGESRIFVTIAWSCEKLEPISWPMGHFDPASFRASCPVNDYFALNYRNTYDLFK
jgi:hypothetical protein